MSDIIERLKRQAMSRVFKSHELSDGTMIWHPMLLEAADEITRLRAELAAVTAERDMMRNVVAQMSKKIYLHSDAAENVLRNVAASLCELDGYNPDDLASSDNGKSIWPNWHLYIDRARAALEGVTEPASPWRDIESAPKDGTPILCVKKGDGFQPEILHFEDGVFGWLTDDMGFGFHPNRQPTHWMPLPEPPR